MRPSIILLFLLLACSGFAMAQPLPITNIGTNISAGGDVVYYQISSSPQGAQVSVDQVNRGVTPVTIEVSSAKSGHTVNITMDGYQMWSQYYSGTASPGSTITISAVLVPETATQPGLLQIASDPTGADVYLDSNYIGQTPEAGAYLRITNLTPKDYLLTVKKAGYLDYITSITVVSGKTIPVSVKLQPAGGNSQLSSAQAIFAGVIILIIILVVAYIVIRRRKKEKPPIEKIELD